MAHRPSELSPHGSLAIPQYYSPLHEPPGWRDTDLYNATVAFKQQFNPGGTPATSVAAFTSGERTLVSHYDTATASAWATGPWHAEGHVPPPPQIEHDTRYSSQVQHELPTYIVNGGHDEADATNAQPLAQIQHIEARDPTADFSWCDYVNFSPQPHSTEPWSASNLRTSERR